MFPHLNIECTWVTGVNRWLNTACNFKKMQCVISARTLGRWRKHASLADARKAACKHCPQVLTEQDTQRIVQVYNSPKCATAPSTKACHRRRSCRAWLMWVVHRQRVKLLQSAAHIGPTILTNTATDRG